MKSETIHHIFLKSWRPYAWITAFIGLLYARSLFFGYTYLDDNQLILNNFHFIKDIGNIFQAFFQDVFMSYSDAYYRPLLTISFILDAQLWGTNIMGYHFSNIVFHVIASSLLLALLTKLGYQRLPAFLLTIVFAIHPVLTQAVAWIPGRNDTLAAIFVLLSMLTFLQSIKSRYWLTYILHFLCFTLALFTKESVLLMALIFLFYLYGIAKEKLKSIPTVVYLGGWMISTGLWFSMRQLALTHQVSVDLLSWITNCPAGLQLFGKIFFPFNLSVLPVIQDTTLWYGLSAMVCLAVLIIFTRDKRYSFLGFGFAWFFLFLAPTFFWTSAKDVTFFLEHRMVLPFMGLIIIFLETTIGKKISEKKSFLWLWIIIIMALSFQTFRHSIHFKNRISFWKNAAQNSPHSPLAQRNLGAMYYLENNLEDAEMYYRKSLALNPQEPMANMNLGLIYAQQKKYAEAEKAYLKELKINPHYDNAHFNLGLLYYQVGLQQKAAVLFQKTIELNPNYFDAYQYLALYYIDQGKLDQARYSLQQAQKRGGQIHPQVINAFNRKSTEAQKHKGTK